MQDQNFCGHGLVVFETVCAEIVDRSVTIGTLKCLSLHKSQVGKLCDIVSSQKRKQHSLSYKMVGTALDARLAEYDTFIECFEKLQNICSHLTGFGM